MAIDIVNSFPVAPDVESAFHRMVTAWKSGTAHLSSLSEKHNHWAYQRIIAMGTAVVPLILKEMETNPDYWFFALRKITGENPVPPESRGKLGEMTSAWLQWARDHGISW